MRFHALDFQVFNHFRVCFRKDPQIKESKWHPSFSIRLLFVKSASEKPMATQIPPATTNYVYSARFESVLWNTWEKFEMLAVQQSFESLKKRRASLLCRYVLPEVSVASMKSVSMDIQHGGIWRPCLQVSVDSTHQTSLETTNHAWQPWKDGSKNVSFGDS